MIEKQIVISEREYIWKDLCLANNGKDKRKTLNGWSIPSVFKDKYVDGTQRIFCITFPEEANISPIVAELSISSGREILFKGKLLELCKRLLEELGSQFEIIIQGLDLTDDFNEEDTVTPAAVIERLVKQRTRQQKYRKDLMSLWGGKCALTGIAFAPLLVSSHIKAFSLSEEIEKYDVANGLLLSANIDKLFDLGLISFDDTGKILISSELQQSNLLGQLNIDQESFLKFENLADVSQKDKILNYLAFHRDHRFRGF